MVARVDTPVSGSPLCVLFSFSIHFVLRVLVGNHHSMCNLSDNRSLIISDVWFDVNQKHWLATLFFNTKTSMRHES